MLYIYKKKKEKEDVCGHTIDDTKERIMFDINGWRKEKVRHEKKRKMVEDVLNTELAIFKNELGWSFPPPYTTSLKRASS